ncbi:unnamed protein product [Choristocarpus tenellus]
MNTRAEIVAEEAAREGESVTLPKKIGAGVGLDVDGAELDRAIEILETFISKDRVERMQRVLDQRTISTTVMFENPSNPNNVWACLRTLDSFGIQHGHIVSDPDSYSKKARLETMVTAMGSQKWMTLHGHASPEAAVEKLKAEGFQVVATDLSPSTVSIDQIDWSVKTAVVMGNENRGISDEMRGLADKTFQIPMRGFAESFNLSVACSIILAHLSATRALRHGDLPEDERRRINATWLMQCVRGADKILKREGITVCDRVWGPLQRGTSGIAGYTVR